MLLLMPACGGNSHASSHEGEAIEMRHARNLQIRELAGGVTSVTLRNPWDTLRNLATYVLVEKGRQAPANLPAGAIVVSVPLEKSVVYSGVHISLLRELQASRAVAGTCDVAFLTDSATIRDVAEGRIADCGKNQNPNIERIISLQPDAILLSPFENSDETARFSKTGIKVIQTADYLEDTPLGRAEWMRFYGRLYGRGAEADSLFSEVERRYDAAKAAAAKSGNHPVVMFDRPYSGVWDVPTSGSVTGHLIADAGGINPFASRSEAGSAHLSPEEVLYVAHDSDIWLIRSFGAIPNMEALARENPIFAKFKAYKEGNVYVADTQRVRLFDDGAFHPDLVLAEMVRILHPATAEGTLKYYAPLK